MELTVRGKNLEITEALRTYVEKHTGKIQRYFDKPIKINVLLRISNMTKTCEVTAFVDGVILRGVEKSDDMYKSIDLVLTRSNVRFTNIKPVWPNVLKNLMF